MTFQDLLRENKDAIIRRWLDEVLATYSEDSSAVFRDQKDPFANPVGHGLRVGTRGIFEALLDGRNAKKIRESLHEIIRMRAIQEFSASEAVGFVFQLKDAIRSELKEAVGDVRFSCELAELERRIDRIGLTAFDVFVECRQQVYELRMKEAKRRVSWIVEKLNQRGSDLELARTEQG